MHNNRKGSSGFNNKPNFRRPMNRGPRQMFDVQCSDCQKETQVPFKPTEGRPVYCRDCYPKHKNEKFERPRPKSNLPDPVPEKKYEDTDDFGADLDDD